MTILEHNMQQMGHGGLIKLVTEYQRPTFCFLFSEEPAVLSLTERVQVEGWVNIWMAYSDVNFFRDKVVICFVSEAAHCCKVTCFLWSDCNSVFLFYFCSLVFKHTMSYLQETSIVKWFHSVCHVQSINIILHKLVIAFHFKHNGKLYF